LPKSDGPDYRKAHIANRRSLQVAIGLQTANCFHDMEKKLGLKVILRPVPTEFLVVDRLRQEISIAS
jgi:hypothetical protein